MISIPYPDFQQEDPREEKLPKWAQDQIETMRRRIAELARQNHELREGNPKSPFSIRTMDRGENDRFGIGPAHMGWIEFSVDDEHRLRLTEKDGWLEISNVSYNCLEIEVRPRSYNVIVVRPEVKQKP